MKKKNVLISIGALALLGFGAYQVVPNATEDAVMEASVMKVKDFEKHENLKFEVMDTSGLTDKNLSKWFEENKEKKGEHLYFDNQKTYVLLSPGTKAEEDTTIWFDGLKKLNDDTLILGYKLVSGKDLGIKVEKGVIRTMLIATEGKYDKTKAIEVELEESPVDATDEEKQSEASKDASNGDKNESSEDGQAENKGDK